MKTQRVALALSLACLPLTVDAQAAKVDPALAKISKELAAAFSAKDAAKVASFYTDDATLSPPNDAMVRGRAAVQAWAQKNFDQGVSALALTPVESAISGGIGYQLENYTVTIKLPGGPTITDKGRSLLVLKQVGGKWLIAHDIFNSELPPPPIPPTPATPAKK